VTGAELRALDCWGPEGGLLSESELDWLMDYVSKRWFHHVLEVGHYTGLSTLALIMGARLGKLTTVDHHKGDKWVSGSSAATFLCNIAKAPPSKPLPDVIIAPYDTAMLDWLKPSLLFWDADHGHEQVRAMCDAAQRKFIRAVVFDDADFEHAKIGAEVLRAHGWRDVSPPLYRGPQDKLDPKTMTLGAFER